MGCRKNQALLNPAERTALVNAMLALKAAPSLAGTASRYDDFVQEHITSMTMGNSWAHRRPAFLPWHREYLRRFEHALQAHDSSVNLPYWDWTVDNLTISSIWDPGFLGGDGTGPGGTVETGRFAGTTGDWPLSLGPDGALRREFELDVPTLPTPQQVSDCLTQTPYDASPWNDSGTLATFRNRLEGWFGAGSIHNRVHRWVGGSMQPSSSPNDPVFWMHHCNIDRLWAIWQRQHPAEPYQPQIGGPAGHNLNDSMQPWGGAATVASTLNHHGMGYWYDTDPPEVTLVTPSLSFLNVPQGLGGAPRTTYRAVVFEVRSCAPVTLSIAAGPSAGFATTPLGTSVSVSAAHGDLPAIGRLWIAYSTTNVGDVATGTVTVTDGTRNWVISLNANTIARPRAAVALALDRSGSMSSDAGDGTSKHARLIEAVGIFVDTMIEGDGLGLVGYDDLVDRHLDIADVGPQPAVPGSGRAQAAAILAGSALDPRGATGIGAALTEAQDVLNDGQAAAAPPYDHLSIVVLTDGIENVSPRIADVMPSIAASTYAVGLGPPSGISVGALDALARASGKSLLITGTLTPDQQFRLTKFFLQILAGITAAQIVVDPSGALVFGPTHRQPFDLAVADHGVDAILVSPLAPLIDFTLEAPDGTVIDPAAAGAGFVARPGVSYYRLSLPIAGNMLSAGRWHALLRLDEQRVRAWLRDDRNQARLRALLRGGAVPYDFLALAHSTLVMEAATSQGLVRPGERLAVSATLTEFGVPVEGRAEVWAEVTAPNGAQFRAPLAEAEGGTFAGELMLAVPGVYQLRVRARGRTLHGTVFTREQMLSAAAGADRGTPPRQEGEDGQGGLLDLLECLAEHGDKPVFGVDPDVLRKCLATIRKRQGTPRIKEARMSARAPSQNMGAGAVADIASLSGITRLVESRPDEVVVTDAHPVDHDDPNAKMFGLSPEDQAIEDERRRTIKRDGAKPGKGEE